MFRFLSVLLILFGLAAAGYGGYRYLQGEAALGDGEVAASVEMAEVPPPPTSRSLSGPGSVGGEILDDIDDMFGITSAGDDFLSTLQTVPIAHETPTHAKFGRSFEVTVAIDATGDTSAADALPGLGDIVESSAQISSDVQATLSGRNFKVEPVTPMIQTVSPMTENIWRWNVTPMEVGAQELTIELFALNGDRAMPVRTFRDNVEVQVSRVGQIIAVANSVSPVAAVIGGIGSLLAGLLGVLRIFGRK